MVKPAPKPVPKAEKKVAPNVAEKAVAEVVKPVPKAEKVVPVTPAKPAEAAKKPAEKGATKVAKPESKPVKDIKPPELKPLKKEDLIALKEPGGEDEELILDIEELGIEPTPDDMIELEPTAPSSKSRHKPKPHKEAPGSGIVCHRCKLELTVLERPYICKQPGLEGYYHWNCFREQVREHQRDAQSLIEESAISAGIISPSASEGGEPSGGREEE